MQKNNQYKRDCFRVQIRRQYNNQLMKTKRNSLLRARQHQQNNSIISKLRESFRLFQNNQIEYLYDIVNLLGQSSIFQHLSEEQIYIIVNQCLKKLLNSFNSSNRLISKLSLMGISNLIGDNKYKNQYFSTNIIQAIVNQKIKRSNIDVEENREIQWIYSNILKNPIDNLNMDHVYQIVYTLTFDIFIDKTKQKQLQHSILQALSTLIKKKQSIKTFKCYLLPFLKQCTSLINEQVKQITIEILKIMICLIRPYFSSIQKHHIQAMISRLTDLSARVVNDTIKVNTWKLLKIIVQQSHQYVEFILKKIETRISMSLSIEHLKIKQFILDFLVTVFEKEPEYARIKLKEQGFYNVLLRLLQIKDNQIKYGSLKIFRLTLTNLSLKSQDFYIYLTSINFKEVVCKIDYASKANQFIGLECNQIIETLEQLDKQFHQNNGIK